MKEKEKAAVAGAAVLAGGIIIGYLLHQCKSGTCPPCDSCCPTSPSFTLILNDSTTSTQGGTGQAVNYQVVGATPHGNVEIEGSFDGGKTYSGGIGYRMADENGSISGSFNVILGWPQVTYIKAYDIATQTFSNAVEVMVGPAMTYPILELQGLACNFGATVAPGGALAFYATNLGAGETWEFVTNTGAELKTGTADQNGTTGTGVSVTIPISTPAGTYTAYITETSTGFSTQCEFTVS